MERVFCFMQMVIDKKEIFITESHMAEVLYNRKMEAHKRAK